MLNEQRVRQMTKLAMFEKENGRKMQPALQYNRKDYVSMRLSSGFISATILYALVYGTGLILLFATVLTNLHTFLLILLLLVGVLLYIIFLYYYLHGVKRRARRDYQVAAKDLKKLQRDLQTLESIYELEEESKAPGVKDEDFRGKDYE
jgi:high-affinity Fe2+/Pb2+ permease